EQVHFKRRWIRGEGWSGSDVRHPGSGAISGLNRDCINTGWQHLSRFDVQVRCRKTDGASPFFAARHDPVSDVVVTEQLCRCLKFGFVQQCTDAGAAHGLLVNLQQLSYFEFGCHGFKILKSALTVVPEAEVPPHDDGRRRELLEASEE